MPPSLRRLIICMTLLITPLAVGCTALPSVVPDHALQACGKAIYESAKKGEDTKTPELQPCKALSDFDQYFATQYAEGYVTPDPDPSQASTVEACVGTLNTRLQVMGGSRMAVKCSGLPQGQYFNAVETAAQMHRG